MRGQLKHKKYDQRLLINTYAGRRTKAAPHLSWKVLHLRWKKTRTLAKKAVNWRAFLSWTLVNVPLFSAQRQQLLADAFPNGFVFVKFVK